MNLMLHAIYTKGIKLSIQLTPFYGAFLSHHGIFGDITGDGIIHIVEIFDHMDCYCIPLADISKISSYIWWSLLYIIEKLK